VGVNPINQMTIIAKFPIGINYTKFLCKLSVPNLEPADMHGRYLKKIVFRSFGEIFFCVQIHKDDFYQQYDFFWKIPTQSLLKCGFKSAIGNLIWSTQ
jgi:hypothetical protein